MGWGEGGREGGRERENVVVTEKERRREAAREENLRSW